MTITIMHTGDEHVDTDAHGAMNPKTGLNTAWESNQRVMRHLAEVAVERKVQAFLSCGDLSKTGRPSQEAVALIVDAYTPLADAGIPIIFLDGNHHLTGVPSDHRTIIHTVAEMLRGRGATVHIASDPKLIRLDSGLQIAALPWLAKNRILNMLEIVDLTPAAGDSRVAEYGMNALERMAEEADSDSPLIMASHVTVDDVRIDAVADGFRRGSEMEIAHLFSEPVLPRKQLELLPFSYGALSHIHTPQAMGKKYWYAGSPNRLTFTDMKDEKGGNLVTIGEQGLISVERILTPARKMAQIDLDVAGFAAALDTLEEGTLVRVLLETGNPEVPREIRKAITAAGAILADTKARPKPRETVARVVLPEKVDPGTALRAWAAHNAPKGVDVEHLVAAAEKLDAA